MQRTRIVEREVKENDRLFVSLHLKTKNADLIMLSETEDQLGTLAVALPQRENMQGPPVSSILLGDRNTIVARMLAERLAHKTGKIALASVFARLPDESIGPVFLKLFDKTLEEKIEEGEKQE